MNSLSKLLPRDRHLLCLLVLTVLVNVPFLTPNLVFVHDSLGCFFHFHYAYSELFLHNDFPRWIPLEGYGVPFELRILTDLQPASYVAMAVGWLTGMEDALLLYKFSFIINQALFVLGLYLLSSSLYASRMATWMVCLGALLTNSWLASSQSNFTVLYLLPLVLYLLLRFVESEKPGFLWSAAIVESLSLLGTMPYIAPMHLLILTTFLATCFWCRPGLLAVFLRWRTYAHPLLPVFLCVIFVLACFVAGMQRSILDSNRNAQTGAVTLDTFIRPGRPRLGALLAPLFLGHLIHGDMTIYAGILPLAGCIYAWFRVRSVAFLAFAAVTMVLFWFSLGGWLSKATYFGLPYMNRFTQIWLAFSLLKIFWLILGGFGLDRLLNRGQRTEDGGQKSEDREQRAFSLSSVLCPLSSALTVLLILPLCCLLDLWIHKRPDEFSVFRLDQVFGPNEVRLVCDYTFSDQWFARYLIWGRFLLYAIVFTLVGFIFPRLARGGKPTSARVVGLLLLGVYFADVGLLYALTVKQAPYCRPHDRPERSIGDHPTLGIGQSLEVPEIGSSFDVHGLDYYPRRQYLSPLPERAENIYHIVTYQRGNIPLERTAVYASLYLMMRIDPLWPTERLNTVMPGVKHMIEARGGSVSGTEGNAFVLPPHEKDAAFWDSLGYRLDKIRVVREAGYVRDEPDALGIFKTEKSPQYRLVVVGPDRSPLVSTNDEELANPHVRFTANRLVLQFDAKAAGWLFAADAYHPGWKATVNGKPADVCRANVGCKAVWVEAGDNTVVFYYDNGLRDRVCDGVVLFASILGFVLVGYLVVRVWRPVPR